MHCCTSTVITSSTLTATKLVYEIIDSVLERTTSDALLGLGVNPLEGSPNVKLRKLRPKGTLLTSNSRKG
jgi:hypothetical protein